MLPLRWNGKARLEGAWLASRCVSHQHRETVGRRKPSSSASPALKMKALLLLVLPWLSPANYIDNVGNLHFLYSELWVRTVAPASCFLSVCLTRAAGRGSPRAFGGVCLSACVSVPVHMCEENPATSCQQLQTVLQTSCFPSGGLIIAVRPHCFLLWKQLRHTKWSCLFPYQLAFLCRHFRWLLGLGLVFFPFLNLCLFFTFHK